MNKWLAVAAMALTATQALAAPPAWLPSGPGQEETAASCGICHNEAYIQMNSRFMKPETWKAEVDKMRAAFGAPIDDDAANEIIAYLVANYGAPPK